MHDAMLIIFVYYMIFFVSILIGSVIMIDFDYGFLSEAHAVGESLTVAIPRGAANPEVDITKLGLLSIFFILNKFP